MEHVRRFPPGLQRMVCVTEEHDGWRRRLGLEYRIAGMQGSLQATRMRKSIGAWMATHLAGAFVR